MGKSSKIWQLGSRMVDLLRHNLNPVADEVGRWAEIFKTH